MWRLTMFVLCLFAAISGTPLRQAEAAADFVRAVDECGQGDTLHDVDGGVGDDKEVSIVKAGGHTQVLPPTISRVTADACFTSLNPVPTLPKIGDRDRAERMGSLSVNSPRRCAWLQRFLF